MPSEPRRPRRKPFWQSRFLQSTFAAWGLSECALLVVDLTDGTYDWRQYAVLVITALVVPLLMRLKDGDAAKLTVR